MTVFALGESYSGFDAPTIELAERSGISNQESITNDSTTVLGAEFFEQALRLFKMPSEEPDVAHVEALNLMVRLYALVAVISDR